METPAAIAIFLGIFAFVWGLFFWQRRRRNAMTRAEVERSGESWVIPPENSYYQGFWGFFSVKTMGGIGLTEDKLIFIPPLGRNMIFPLKDVVSLGESIWFHGNYRNGRAFLTLKMADGKEAGFQVSSEQRWMEELKARVTPTA